jgi:uncharacterized protein YutE (UPF0331/DUF86 family)
LAEQVPSGIAKEWSNLLTQRALLYPLLKKFAGRDDFVRKSEDLSLDARITVAALERVAETVFNVFIDLAKDLLVGLHPDDDRAIKSLPAEVILRQLEQQKIVDHRLRDELDDIREGRNLLLQHESSFAPAAAIWRMAEETNGIIDRAIEALRVGFTRLGYDLDDNLPEIS